MSKSNNTQLARRIAKTTVTFLPTALLAIASLLGLLGYKHHWYADLEAAQLLTMWATTAGFLLVPLWTALRAREHWFVTLVPQLGMLGVQLFLFFLMLTIVPHGTEPPECGTPMAMLFMGLTFGYFSYIACAIPITAILQRSLSKRRRAESA